MIYKVAKPTELECDRQDWFYDPDEYICFSDTGYWWFRTTKPITLLNVLSTTHTLKLVDNQLPKYDGFNFTNILLEIDTDDYPELLI